MLIEFVPCVGGAGGGVTAVTAVVGGQRGIVQEDEVALAFGRGGGHGGLAVEQTHSQKKPNGRGEQEGGEAGGHGVYWCNGIFV